MTVHHYAACDVCSFELRVRDARSQPDGWQRMTAPGTNAVLEICDRCAESVRSLLMRRGWTPSPDPDGSGPP